MTIVEQHKWSALPVPYAIEVPDRVPKERYYDPDFYAMEAELIWPRVWQMACRLEEIPEAGDFAEYQILDQSIVVIRTDDLGVRAFQNVCRHRGVRLAQGRGSRRGGFVCPFHGWCYGPDGHNTRVTQPSAFSEHNLEPDDLDLTPVRCESWGGCAWINLDDGAPAAARVHRALRHRARRLEGGVAAGRVVVRLPPAGQLEAGPRGLRRAVPRVAGTSPAAHPRALPARNPCRLRSRTFVDAELQYLRTMSDGMAGMVHATRRADRRGLADQELPADLRAGQLDVGAAPQRGGHAGPRRTGVRHPRPQRVDGPGPQRADGVLLPPLLRPAHVLQRVLAYRFRPLGPEETLMDIWSLTRFPAGEEPQTPPVPEAWEHDDPRWPPIPAQDFSNLPRQQRGLHARSFEYMRLSERNEGHISNYQRVIDGFLAGLPYEKLLPALRKINVNPLEMPVVEIGF